ncbi:MAG: hypothetical protein ACK40A_18575, partial [Pannonibacter indicus]
MSGSAAGAAPSQGEFVFAPLEPAFAADPYAAYAQLRAREGLTWFPDFKIHLASRFEDVSAIVMDKRMVRSLDGLVSPEEIAAEKRAGNWHDMPHHSRFVQFSLLDSDGEVHDRLRKAVFRLFTPAMIARLRDSIQSYVDGLVDRLLEQTPDSLEFNGVRLRLLNELGDQPGVGKQLRRLLALTPDSKDLQ